MIRISKISKFLVFIGFLFFVDRAMFFVCSLAFNNLKEGQIGVINKAIEAKADIVIVGSSRARRHYDSILIQNLSDESTFNIGCDGQGLPYISATCDILLQQYTPKLIIVELEPQFVIKDLCDTYFPKITLLAPYMDKSQVLKSMIYDLGSFQRIKYMSRTLRYNSLPLAFFYKFLKEDEALQGFVPVDGVMDISSEDNNSPVTLEDKHALNLSCVEMLRKTIRSAKEKGSEIVLVTSPGWGDFLSKNSDVLIFFDQLAKEEGVSYIPFTNENYPQFGDHLLFADQWHLNRQGAEVFTEVIVSWLMDRGFLKNHKSGQ